MDVAFDPCGHAIMCSTCAQRAMKCPICKVSELDTHSDRTYACSSWFAYELASYPGRSFFHRAVQKARACSTISLGLGLISSVYSHGRNQFASAPAAL